MLPSAAASPVKEYEGPYADEQWLVHMLHIKENDNLDDILQVMGGSEVTEPGKGCSHICS